MRDSEQLRQERKKAIEDARTVIDHAATEERELTGEEDAQVDAAYAAADGLNDRIEKLERRANIAAAIERDDHQVAEDRARAARDGNQAGLPGTLESESPEQRTAREFAQGQSQTMLGWSQFQRAMEHRSTSAYEGAFWSAARFGRNTLTQDEARALIGPEELRVLNIGTATAGGNLTPTEFERRLLTILREVNIMRQLSTVIATANDREIPVRDGVTTAGWTTESAVITGEESDETFAQVTLAAHKANVMCKVSEELLQDSAFDLQTFLADDMGGALGVLEEAAFVNGNNSGKPNGLLVASTLGKAAASASAITADELIDLFHSLKRVYRARATFVTSDEVAKLVRKLKDGNSQYIWQPGLQAGQPDTLLGRPVAISDGVPAVATGIKVMAFGDISAYWIADRATRTLQRLDELYAGNGQVGFRLWQRVDGDLPVTEAVKHLIMA